MSGTVHTSVEMANLALAHLKETPISDFDFASVASRWFKNNYAAHRDAYLAQHDWDFATALVLLPVDTATPPFRWSYQYQKPADCLRLPQQTVDGMPDGQIVPYEVIGQKILTDQSAPFPLRYVRRVTREAEFPPLFVHGFALFLAAGCAHLITGKNSLADAMRQAAREVFTQAGTSDAIQGTPLPMIDLDIVTDR